jgi:hypothetical protein
MADSSGNTVVEVAQNSQSQYRKYKYSIRLAHWKTRQDYLVKNITMCQNRIAMYKKKIEKYEEKMYEYESYMIVLNPVGERITQVRSDAVGRLQEAIEEVQDESDGEGSGSDSGSDVQSVATCDTVMQMREQVARRTGRR